MKISGKLFFFILSSLSVLKMYILFYKLIFYKHAEIVYVFGVLLAFCNDHYWYRISIFDMKISDKFPRIRSNSMCLCLSVLFICCRLKMAALCCCNKGGDMSMFLYSLQLYKLCSKKTR